MVKVLFKSLFGWENRDKDLFTIKMKAVDRCCGARMNARLHSAMYCFASSWYSAFVARFIPSTKLLTKLVFFSSWSSSPHTSLSYWWEYWKHKDLTSHSTTTEPIRHSWLLLGMYNIYLHLYLNALKCCRCNIHLKLFLSEYLPGTLTLCGRNKTENTYLII